MLSYGKSNTNEETSTDANTSGFYMQLPVCERESVTEQEVDYVYNDDAVIIDHDYLV